MIQLFIVEKGEINLFTKGRQKPVFNSVSERVSNVKNPTNPNKAIVSVL